MPIKVNISLSAGGRFKPVSSHTLHEKRITVGRDKECTLSLEDTQKHVSRVHAEIFEEEGHYWMKVVSKVNPVAVNGKRYTYGDRVVVLADGDQVSVGLYKLEIIQPAIAPPPSKAAPAPPPRVAAEDITYVSRPQTARPAAQAPQSRLPEEAAEKEEATYIPPPKAPSHTAPDPKTRAPQAALPESALEAEEATYIPPAKAETPAVQSSRLPESAITDNEVTYIPPMSARLSTLRDSFQAPGPPERSDQVDAEDVTGVWRPPVEVTKPPVEAAKPPVEAAKPPVEAAKPPVEAAKPPAPAEPAAELDLDLSDAFDAQEEQTAIPRPATPAPEPEVEEGFSEDLTYVRRPPPKPAPPPTPDVPAYTEADRLAEEETQYRTPLQEIAARIAAKAKAPAAPSTPAADPGAARAVQAFLEGAGLPHLQIPDAEAFMRDSGVMVRAAVEGIMMLLLARAETRKELGAEIDAGEVDNPVTSMADPAEVIAFLFDPNRPAIGDINPVQAFSDACTDLRAHQVALIAGMRAAVMSALLTIDPKKIEREHGVTLGGLNLTRKSKLWDISVAQHEQLAREMEENFNNVFGREILAAYTAQVRKMRGGR